jgi:hypothetical protein
LVAVLGRVGRRFQDPADPLYEEAVARIPMENGLSKAMAHEIITGMARDWTTERLEALVSADFPDPTVLDRFRPGPAGDRVRAVGGDLAFHVGAGSVPGVGAISLLRSLLVKCPVLLKPGRGDLALPCLLARGILEEDEGLARAVAVVYWPVGEGGDLERVALAEAERVVVYGGRATVAQIRSRVPVTTPIVAYHHRISMGAVAADALETPASADRVATEAARAVALFDQRGCVSPHAIWVEQGAEITPRAWAARLAVELAALARSLPQGPPDRSTSSSMHQLRGTVELRAAGGAPVEVHADPDGKWAVVFDPEPGPADICGGRTVTVRPFASLDDIVEALARLRPVLQTFAVAGSEETRSRIAERLARCGVTRITTFRDQPWPPAWWRHDGQGPLLALVRWIGFES